MPESDGMAYVLEVVADRIGTVTGLVIKSGESLRGIARRHRENCAEVVAELL